MSNNRIGTAAGILFWVLLLASALYISIKGIRNYADVPIYLAALRIIELFGLLQRQIEKFLFLLIPFLLIVWIVIERVNSREMARSHDKSKWAIPSGVITFIAVLNSIIFSFLSMVVLDSVEMDRVFGDSGILAAMVIAPLIPSGLISFVILQNCQWVSYTLLLTLFAGLYLVFSCFYCIG